MHETEMTRKYLTNILNQHEHCYLKKTVGSAFSKGMPDLVGTVYGRSTWIEVKKPGNKATPQQLTELKAHAAAGGYSAVCTIDTKNKRMTWETIGEGGQAVKAMMLGQLQYWLRAWTVEGL